MTGTPLKEVWAPRFSSKALWLRVEAAVAILHALCGDRAGSVGGSDAGPQLPASHG